MDLFKRTKYNLIFLGCLLCGVPLLAQISQPSDSLTGISVRCEFSGLSVWVGDSLVGHTPLSMVSLGEGEYQIRVRHPQPADWLSRDWEGSVRLVPGQIREFVIIFPDYFWIGSRPIGASVYRRDELLGKTPLVVRRLQTGGDRLLIKKNGYRESVLFLNETTGSRISVELTDEGSARDMPKPPERLKKGWIIGLGVFGLVSGITGYYLKDRAERAYDQYMKSGNPEKMDKYFDKATRFDRLSGVFYGIGEVSLGVSLVLSIRNVSSK